MGKEMSRRSFIKTGTAAALGLTIAPSTILGKVHGHTAAPSDKLNILGVGIGGRGSAVLHELDSQNIIGLCDGCRRSGYGRPYPCCHRCTGYGGRQACVCGETYDTFRI